MKKQETLAKITRVGVVAVVRADTVEEAIRVSKACVDGGVFAIEVTYTVPGASEVIEELRGRASSDLIIGAGTILDSETARTAILAGAEYIVSPVFDSEIAKLCNRYAIPYMPGCMTITEMLKAMEGGCDIIKLFPGSAFGPSYIKGVKGPLPQVNIMPTGGVSVDNVEEWIKNGAIAVGVGGKLTKGSSESISNTAKLLVERVENVRKNMGKKYLKSSIEGINKAV